MEEKAVGVFGLEELFKVTLAGDDLVKFLEDRELALSNLEKEPYEDVGDTRHQATQEKPNAAH